MTTTTLNPSDKAANATLSNGNLTITTTTTPYSSARSTASKSSSKLYFELTVDSVGGTSAISVGLADASASLTTIPGVDTHGVGWSLFDVSFRYNGVQKTPIALGTITAGSVIGVAIDFGNLNLWIRGPNGNWNGNGTDNPATNTGGLNGSAFFNGAMNTFLGSAVYAMVSTYDNSKGTVNFGASALAYTAPSGFSTWDPPVGETSTGTMSFGGLAFSGSAKRVETTTSAMAFSGIRLSGSVTHAESAVGRMTFAGLSIVGGANFTKTGAGTLHFSGLAMAGHTSRAENVAGLMNFGGIAIRGSVFDYPPAGTGRRSSWTFGA